MTRWIFVQQREVAWVPTNLSTLVAWLDADDAATLYDATSGGALVTAHDAQVKRWEDKSGNAHHAIQNSASGPKIQTTSGTLNGRPVLKFVAANDSFLTIADHADFRTYPLTVLTVFRTSVSSANKGVLGKWGGSGQREWVVQHNAAVTAKPIATLRNSADSGNILVQGANTIHNGVGRLFGATFDPPSGDLDLWIDGSNAATAAATSSNGSSTQSVAVGSYSSDNAGVELTGDIAEVVIANTSGDSDREKIEGYLAHKWGLTSGLPVGHPYKSIAPTA